MYGIFNILTALNYGNKTSKECVLSIVPIKDY